jgi:hypothetical protein
LHIFPKLTDPPSGGNRCSRPNGPNAKPLPFIQPPINAPIQTGRTRDVPGIECFQTAARPVDCIGPSQIRLRAKMAHRPLWPWRLGGNFPKGPMRPPTPARAKLAADAGDRKTSAGHRRGSATKRTRRFCETNRRVSPPGNRREPATTPNIAECRRRSDCKYMRHRNTCIRPKVLRSLPQPSGLIPILRNDSGLIRIGRCVFASSNAPATAFATSSWPLGA